ncbi:hypothetical protein HG536_0G01170 [Torulaspora globosa]|uniref:DUF4484 domain-containing protein n=1 Tax=Torulaspora globosa TaxID=48254 RepID=A0A7G3ZL72_9SACH|nr:uncharacterized protein HG536_0G01170 [Torulaspora globosa]QLL34258.1 hypothetical protein HG536_0G01170 [Torulaspora globosa]
MPVRNGGMEDPCYARERFRITKPPHKIPISCMFLSNFEITKGNITVWSRKWSETNCEIDLENVEFKALPSGIHEVSDDVINFVLPKEVPGDEYHYGVAYYQQNGQEMAEGTDHVDRNAVKMYALGVIVDPNYRVSGVSDSGFNEWKPNQFTSANDYVDDLQDLLTHWLAKKEYDNFSLFDEYFDCNGLTNDAGGLASPMLQRSGKPARDIFSHDSNAISKEASRPQMLDYLPFWIRKLGPLVFPLWKSCLLGERILILNPQGGSFELCNALNYCLSIISLIPKALQIDRHEEYEYFVKPLFTIGISDIDSMVSDVRQVQRNAKVPGFIACTSDEIIISKIELYDKVLKLSKETTSQDGDDAAIYSNTGLQIKATPHDFESLQSLYDNFLHEEMSSTAKVRCMSMIEPKTWTQCLIDGFYWWATAGYVKPSYQEHAHSTPTSSEDNEVEMILSIIGYFHDRTSTLFNKLKAIIQASEHQGSDEVISIHPMTLGDMDLDCFSMQDRDFIIALSWKLFQREVRITGDYYEAIC